MEKTEKEPEFLPDAEEREITAHSVKTNGTKIDYDKFIKDFGVSRINQDHLKKIAQLTNQEPHRFLRRGIFFTHRDLENVLDKFEKGDRFYLYTGRGPSSESMHIGHLIPFLFTKWLQDAFNVPLVIQITDDEKFFYRGDTDSNTLEKFTQMGRENIKDIIACGFNLEKTFIFLDTQYIGDLYPNVCKVQRLWTYNQVRGCFGADVSDNCGKISYPAIQAAPSFSNSFPHIFGKKTNNPCLIPQALDQDDYFRLTRDIAPKLGYEKPACIHSKFIPSIKGVNAKMAAGDPGSAIYLTDTPEVIADKIKKFAYTGGGQTLEKHRTNGADLDVDIPFIYLTYFLEDDKELELIAQEYGSGKMLTSKIKERMTQVIQKVVREHQERRAKVTDAMVDQFLAIRPIKP